MRQLHRRNGALRADERRDARPRMLLRSVPDAGVIRRDAAFRRDRRGLGEHHRSATHGTRTQMHEMPIVRYAIARRVLAHRRDHDAVAQARLALLKTGKQMHASSSVNVRNERAASATFKPTYAV